MATQEDEITRHYLPGGMQRDGTIARTHKNRRKRKKRRSIELKRRIINRHIIAPTIFAVALKEKAIKIITLKFNNKI